MTLDSKVTTGHLSCVLIPLPHLNVFKNKKISVHFSLTVPSISAFLWLFSPVIGRPCAAHSGTEVCRDKCSSGDTDTGIPSHPKSELNNRALVNYSKEVDTTGLSLLINTVGDLGQQKEPMMQHRQNWLCGSLCWDS